MPGLAISNKNEDLINCLEDDLFQLPDRYPVLLHRIPVTDGDRIILFGLVINRYAEWSA